MPLNILPRDIKLGRAFFFNDPVENKARSLIEGRPIYDDVESVKVTHPGDTLLSWIGPVKEIHHINGEDYTATDLWPGEYEAWKKGEQRATNGTPLEMWPNPLLTAARVAELKAIDILSVEDLAAVQDSHLRKMGMGARDLRDQAVAYIKTAKDSAATAAMAAQIAQMQRTIEQLQAAAQGAPISPPHPDTESPLTIMAHARDGAIVRERILNSLQPAPEDLPPQPQAITEKPIEACSDDELKQYIKNVTGQAPRGTPSRETLVAKVMGLAQERAA